METIHISMNAVRVCDAIARIGYEPHSALMDIIDNSVAASALNIRLIVDLVAGKTINQRNNVSRYRIIDDGNGMDEAGILNAFKLGSDMNYSPNSLSKYGMGLKSAGFSLGTKIQIICKQGDVLTKKYFIDRKVIEDLNNYVVCCDALTDEECLEYNQLFGDNTKGTIVEITGCCKIYHASAKTTIEKLKHRLGVTYYPFLSAPAGSKLNIVLTYPGEESHQIQPVDILFTDDADLSYDPSTYQGINPCFAFNDLWKIPAIGDLEAPPIKLEVVTFPKDAMAGAGSPLKDNEKSKVKSYMISRENKGFFVYRNGRLIRWGDDLGDIITKDNINFRARMELNTAHDDLLHVDVSKQRLEMDDETKAALKILMRLPKKQAESIFEICEHLLKKGDGEGTGFIATADSIPEEDPAEDMTPPDPVVKKKRASIIEKESKETLESIEKKENAGEPSVQQEEKFRQVRYTENYPGMGLWSAQKDPVQGTYVLVNRRHAFYQSVIANLDESAPERLALEAIFLCSAIGENKTYENLTSVEDNIIKKVFERYESVFSFNLNAWSAGNQQLFEK